MAERDPKFYSELKQLNDDFIKLIESTHKKSPYFDFTPTLNDYIRQFNELDKQYPPGENKANNQLATTTVAPQQQATTNNITFVSTSATTSTLNTTSPPKLTPFAPVTPFSATVNTSTTTTTTANSNTTPFAPLFSSSTQPFVFGVPASTTSSTSTGQPASASNASSFFSFNLAKKEEPKTTAINTNTTFSALQANETAATGDDADDDAPPPEPNVDKYEEPNAKYQIRCKLYERGNVAGGAAQISLLGFGVLFVKQLDSPNKLQVIVRQDPDLRRVLLNEAVTQNIPLKLLPKAVQLIVPGPNGESKFYIAKVKEEKDANQLYELLNSTRTQTVT